MTAHNANRISRRLPGRSLVRRPSSVVCCLLSVVFCRPTADWRLFSAVSLAAAEQARLRSGGSRKCALIAFAYSRASRLQSASAQSAGSAARGAAAVECQLFASQQPASANREQNRTRSANGAAGRKWSIKSSGADDNDKSALSLQYQQAARRARAATIAGRLARRAFDEQP